LFILEVTRIHRYDDSQKPKMLLVPEMIRKIQMIIKVPVNELVNKTNDVFHIADKVLCSMTSKRSREAIKVALYKRQLHRFSRAKTKEQGNDFKKKAKFVYTKCGYSEHGSHESSGGGALPLSLKSASKLAEIFFEISHITDEPIVILLV
jgi:hypothetical protein